MSPAGAHANAHTTRGNNLRAKAPVIKRSACEVERVGAPADDVDLLGDPCITKVSRSLASSGGFALALELALDGAKPLGVAHKLLGKLVSFEVQRGAAQVRLMRVPKRTSRPKDSGLKGSNCPWIKFEGFSMSWIITLCGLKRCGDLLR